MVTEQETLGGGGHERWHIIRYLDSAELAPAAG